MSKLLSDRYVKELFELGSAYSDPVEVFPNIKVVFRILSVDDLVEVGEALTEFTGIESRTIVSQVQTLARAIVEINGMVLVLPPAEVDKLEEKLNRKVTRVDQAAYILATEFPKFMLDELNQAYINYYRDVLEDVDSVKKKSKKP